MACVCHVLLSHPCIPCIPCITCLYSKRGYTRIEIEREIPEDKLFGKGTRTGGFRSSVKSLLLERLFFVHRSVQHLDCFIKGLREPQGTAMWAFLVSSLILIYSSVLSILSCSWLLRLGTHPCQPNCAGCKLEHLNRPKTPTSALVS